MIIAADVIKDPNSIMDRGFDWSDWLPITDSIIDSEWINPSSDIVIILDSFDTISTLAWFSGGVIGSTYRVTNRITTLEGRTEDRTLAIIVKER